MTHKVFFSTNLNSLLNAIRPSVLSLFRNCDQIAIKIHFGEPNNPYTFKPEHIKPITDLLQQQGKSYFLYDSSVVYPSPRDNPATHLKLAQQKGWDKLGPIKTNDDYIVKQGNILTYKVCKELADADGVLVISHVKGHLCSGFGGAIKNLGMGGVEKESKKAIHSGAKPMIVGECNQCGICAQHCPVDGIIIEDKPIFKICFGCSNCIIYCPQQVLKPRVHYFDALLADSAATVAKTFKQSFYISYIINIAKTCDCDSEADTIIAQDIGYVASENLVAIDKASYDLILQYSKEDVFLKYNKKRGIEQINYAQQYLNQNSAYELISIE